MLMNPKRFLNKVVLITGASSGIGRATAVAFAREGARVLVACRRQTEAVETVRMIEDAGSVGRFVQTDVTRPSEVERMVAGALHSFGRLDIAFNNAGTAESPKAFIDQPEEVFDRVMAVTVKGVWLCMKAEITQMLKTGGGAIVNMASIGGVVGAAGAPIYAASKHAVIGLTKSTALEYARSGIRINAVCPGAIETESLGDYFRKNEEVKKKMVAGHPIGRLGTPEEVAFAVLWLCLPDSAFVLGHSLLVDGGFTAQ